MREHLPPGISSGWEMPLLGSAVESPVIVGTFDLVWG
jgi:hypothetical protein